MLRFCLGRAGSGKTDWIYQDICSALAQGMDRAVLIVPEQYSFESERALAQQLGPQYAAKGRVYSFTRLIHEIFRAFGGFSARALDDTGRKIFMHLALSDCRDQLIYYKRQAAYPAFQEKMLNTVAACKNALVTSEMLLDAAALQPQDSTLRQKAEDIALLFSSYDAYVSQSCLDPLDDPLRAAQLLKERVFFRDCGVWVDGFKDFSAAQQLLLRRILCQCPSMTVSLCADGLWSEQTQEDDLFAPTRETARRLMRIAREEGCPVAAPVLLAQQPRYQEQSLAFLETNLYQLEPRRQAGIPGGVILAQARNAYEEAEYAALCIRRLVREQGYRYRQISLLVRRSDWWPILDSAFRRYQIPFFRDERISIRFSPLITLVFSSLRACSRMDSEEIFTLCKTQLLPFSERALEELENYCFTYSITGNKWLAPFAGNPEGLQEKEMTSGQIDLLLEINTTRESLTAPLLRLREAVKDCDGAQLTAACYQLLLDYQVPQQIESLCASLPEGTDREQMLLLPRVWELLMDAFDRLVQALSGIPMTLERYLPLLEQVLSCADLGQLPQSMDCVTMGLVDRARPSHPRAMFLLGLNEGLFPQQVRDSGLFSQQEKELLSAAGVELSLPLSRQIGEERYQCYTAMASPSCLLHLSYSLSNLSGDALRPSELVRQVRRMFPELPLTMPQEEPIERRVETLESAFSLYCSKEGQPVSGSLSHLLRQSSRYSRLLDRMERTRTPDKLKLERVETARKLFGTSMRLSPSRLERFYQCPFLYFCQDGLRVKPRPKAKITALETGSLVHYALEQICRRHPGKELSQLADDALWREIRQVSGVYIRRAFAGAVEEQRVKYQLDRICGNLFHLLRSIGLEFEQSRFVPVDFELSISPGGQVEPLVLRTPLGASVQVEGRVDRVDTMEKDGVCYLRVVDYKTGSKQFRLSDVYQGINMQMLLYLFTIWKNGTERYGELLPAGVLYLPSTVPMSSSSLGEEPVRTVKMNGLLLDDPNALHGMEPGMKGVFIPCKVKKDGTYDAYSSVATLEQMGRLSRMIDCRISQMADQLLKGQVEAVPLSFNGGVHCDYCEYRAVCTREQEDPLREAPDLDSAQVLERIEAELEKGELDPS